MIHWRHSITESPDMHVSFQLFGWQSNSCPATCDFKTSALVQPGTKLFIYIYFKSIFLFPLKSWQRFWLISDFPPFFLLACFFFPKCVSYQSLLFWTSPHVCLLGPTLTLKKWFTCGCFFPIHRVGGKAANCTCSGTGSSERLLGNLGFPHQNTVMGLLWFVETC